MHTGFIHLPYLISEHGHTQSNCTGSPSAITLNGYAQLAQTGICQETTVDGSTD